MDKGMPSEAFCLPVGSDPVGIMMMGSPMGPMMGTPDGAGHDSKGKSDGGSAKDKGRGSYRCGKCGVPKKGHVCPYQPKLKRRPDEPPPEMKSASTQVEMDEVCYIRI